MRRGEFGGCDICLCVLWMNGSDYTWQRVNCVYLIWSLSQLTMCLCCMCFCAKSGPLLCLAAELYGVSHKPAHRLAQKADDQSLPHVRLCVPSVSCMRVCRCLLLLIQFFRSAIHFMLPVAPTMCLKGALSLLSVPIHLACLNGSVLRGLLLSSKDAVHTFGERVS